MCVDKLFLTHFPPFFFVFFYVLQCIQTIDKHLNTAINFRKSRKIHTQKEDRLGDEKKYLANTMIGILSFIIGSPVQIYIINRFFLLYFFYFQELPDNLSCSKWLMKTQDVASIHSMNIKTLS